MKNLKDFLIQFSGLKLGKHQFEFQIDNKFFEHFEYSEFNDANINIAITLDKKSTLLEFIVKHKGTVKVPCDLSNEEFDLPIKGKMNLLVKFGDEFNDENEEIIILPHGEFQIDISQYVFESIVLSVPTKRVHPGIKDGTLETDALKNLEKFAPKNSKSETQETDPRWDNLKKLLTDKDKLK